MEVSHGCRRILIFIGIECIIEIKSILLNVNVSAYIEMYLYILLTHFIFLGIVSHTDELFLMNYFDENNELFFESSYFQNMKMLNKGKC